MQLFGVEMPLAAVIIGAIVIIGLIVLIILAIISDAKKKTEVKDLDTREEFGDFHGLLTKEDFEVRSDDRTLEMYREQWIKAAPGDEKDNYLLLYLALKQLNKEQDESEDEWTQEQCEARMDEIIEDLTARTGLKLIVRELDDTEYDTYFDNEVEDEEYDEEDEETEEEEN